MDAAEVKLNAKPQRRRGALVGGVGVVKTMSVFDTMTSTLSISSDTTNDQRASVLRISPASICHAVGRTSSISSKNATETLVWSRI